MTIGKPEPKYVFEPLPISNKVEYLHSKRQLKKLELILSNSPIHEDKIIKILNFASFKRRNKETNYDVTLLLEIGLLKKADDKIIPTKAFVDFIKRLASEIETFERATKSPLVY